MLIPSFRGMTYLVPPDAAGLDATIPWTAITPDGSAVPGIQGTTSSGFNETEAYDFLRGWGTYVIGAGEYSGEGGGPPRNQLTVFSAGGFIVKPLANRILRFENIQMIGYVAADGATLNIDSMMKGALIMEGCEVGACPAVGNAATTCAVRFKPTLPVPSEGVIGIVDSRIQLGNLIVAPGSGAGPGLTVVDIDLTHGGFNCNLLEALEINGGNAVSTPNAKYGIYAHGAEIAGYSFAGNIFNVAHVHLANVAVVQIGNSAVNQGQYSGNVLTFGAIMPGYHSKGIDNWGTNNSITVGLINNGENTSGFPYTYGFFAEPGGIGNSVRIANMNGAGTVAGNPGVGGVTGNDLYINGQRYAG
jgi:hypothetical protein